MPAFIDGFIDPERFLPFMIFAIPIVAIIGGITAGIVKQLSDARLIENAQRERMAAIQRGLDPSQLPPLPLPGQTPSDMLAGYDPVAAQRHRAQGLLIGGIITFFGGIGLGIFLYFITGPGDDQVWAVGVLPVFVGLALLLSAWLIQPRGGSGSGRGPNS